MNTVIITDYGVALGKTGDRLVRGLWARLVLTESGHRRPCTNVRAAVYLGL